MDAHSKNQYPSKRKGKSHLSWRKRQRRLNEPLVERIEEQVMKVEAENDNPTDTCINVLSSSSDSINTDSSEFNKSFNLTICHDDNYFMELYGINLSFQFEIYEMLAFTNRNAGNYYLIYISFYFVMTTVTQWFKKN